MEDSQAQEPATPESEATTQPRIGIRRYFTRKVQIIAVAALILAAIIVALVVVISRPSALESAAAACEGSKPYYALLGDEGSLAPAADSEGDDYVASLFEDVITVEDGGKTLIVQTKPQDVDPIGVSALALDCLYEELDVPRRVSELIAATRSLDGRQTGDWDNFSASWSYHPDNGLNLIIAED